MITKHPQQPSASPSKWDEAAADFIDATRISGVRPTTLEAYQRQLANVALLLGDPAPTMLTLADSAKG